MLHVLTERLALGQDARITLAYSGGVDSHVLLHALTELRARTGWRLSAVHVDHGLHPQSAEWVKHCLRICRQLEVPCQAARVVIERSVPEGIEAAARRHRYDLFARRLAPGDVLMTAHHRDDQAETVLLQLLRGTGVQGLAAMPMEADFAEGRLLRPLLIFTRDELEAYARQHRLDWIEDASNADQGLARNYLRHRVMPVLRERWHDMSECIARAARHSADAALLLDDLARMDLAETVHAEAGLSVPALLKLPRPRVRNLLRHWIRHQGLPVPTTQQLEHLILHVFQPTRTAHALVTWPGAEVRRYRDILTAMPPLTNIDRTMELLWDPDQPLEIPGTDYRLSTIAARGQGLSLLRTRTTPLRVRFRRGGEICVLAGRGHHHKLKKLFQEAGIPPWERYRFPLVYVGADLAAIGDRWVCEPYAAGPEEQGIRVVMSKTVCNGVKLSGEKIQL